MRASIEKRLTVFEQPGPGVLIGEKPVWKNY